MHEVGKKYGFFLCDGLGGMGKGDVASETAVRQAIIQFEEKGCSRKSLADIFEASQAAVLEKQKEQAASHSMKTTMTALLIDGKKVYWGHVGDSRIYYFDNRRLIARTLDHSVPQMLVAAGEIKEKEIRNHPDRNRLLRVIGVNWDSPQYQLADDIELNGNQAFLMCSDGFWELIEEKEMQILLKKSKSVEEWVNSMELIVQKRGKNRNMDNYSAIAVWITR
jgi:serine/threonine protein phosphatase PrpC